MRVAPILNALAVFAAILFLYLGHGYYIDRTMENACLDSQEFLSTLSKTALLDLISNFDTPPERITQNYLAPKITETRKIKNITNPITLSELETLYLVLGDYLEPEGCDLFKNLASAGQARAVLLYTEEFKKADHKLLLSEIDDLQEKSNFIDHINPAVSCGFGVDNPILSKKEPEYCSAIHEQNYLLVKQLELQIEKDDQISQTYKALFANCLADCLNKEMSCVETCWKQKLT